VPHPGPVLARVGVLTLGVSNEKLQDQ
jgi:hypothetical protein